MTLPSKNSQGILLIGAAAACLVLTVCPVTAQTVEDYRSLADSLIAAEDLSAAADALREAYSLDETNLDILRTLAEVSLHLGDFAAARQALQLVIEGDPADADSYLEIARIEWLSGSPDISLQFIDLAEKVAVKPADKIPAYRSIVLRGAGLLAEAESVLVAAQETFPESPLILSNLGLVAALRGKRDESFRYAQRAYEIDSNEVFAVTSLASIHLADGNLDEAKRLYERALDIDPINYFTKQSLESFERLTIQTELDSLMREGIRCFDKSLYLKARRAFRQAVERDSTFFEAHLNLGFTLNLLGEPRNAIHVFKKAAKLDSTSAPLYIGWANALAGIGEFDEAIQRYERAIELDSTITEVYEALRAVRELKERTESEKR
jgi:tetratricopeptide (TPR) repeat protein